jgi:hypothetical protein
MNLQIISQSHPLTGTAIRLGTAVIQCGSGPEHFGDGSSAEGITATHVDDRCGVLRCETSFAIAPAERAHRIAHKKDTGETI